MYLGSSLDLAATKTPPYSPMVSDVEMAELGPPTPATPTSSSIEPSLIGLVGYTRLLRPGFLNSPVSVLKKRSFVRSEVPSESILNKWCLHACSMGLFPQASFQTPGARHQWNQFWFLYWTTSVVIKRNCLTRFYLWRHILVIRLRD